MFKVSTEKLLENSKGQYNLLAVAFQRLHQLNSGMLALVKAHFQEERDNCAYGNSRGKSQAEET